jgi:hypothetical protein
MKEQLNERLTRTPFRPSADARADYETDGTTFLQYLARRAAKTIILEPLQQLLAVRRPGGPIPAAALVCFAYYAVAASTSYGRGYRQPSFSSERAATEKDRETSAVITATSIGARGDLAAEITAEVAGIGRFVGNERILGTTVGLRGLGMAAPSQFSFETAQGRGATLLAWRGEARGTVTTELAPSFRGTTVRAYGSLALSDDAGSTGTATLNREGETSITVTDRSGGVYTLNAPLK